MTYDRQDRIRRAAILVASLEETMAEAMLRGMGIEAERILAELERIGEVDPEEQRDVLEEFRAATRREPTTAVEFTYSAPAVADRDRTKGERAAGQHGPGSGPPLTESDAAAMAELLAQEHPQIIAAALARLGEDRGAIVFAALPAELQSEVMERLARLSPPDEEAVAEVESQLLRELDNRRQSRERAEAAAGLARSIIARTSPARQAELLNRLAEQANGVTALHAVLPHAGGRRELQSAASNDRRGSRGVDPVWLHPHVRTLHVDDRIPELPQATLPRRGEVVPPDRSSELEAMTDEQLLAALRLADEHTVHRALAASSEAFMRRITRRLRWRQAAALRRAVRAVGPLSLAELRHSQAELLRLAGVGRDERAAA